MAWEAWQERVSWIAGGIAGLVTLIIGWRKATKDSVKLIQDAALSDLQNRAERADEATERAHRNELVTRDRRIEKLELQVDYLLEALMKLEREDDRARRGAIIDKAVLACLAQRGRPDGEASATLDEVSEQREDDDEEVEDAGATD